MLFQKRIVTLCLDYIIYNKEKSELREQLLVV